MSASKSVLSLAIFSISSIFWKRLNAIGISNLPAAIDGYRRARQTNELKLKYYHHLVAFFQLAAVISGISNCWPLIIQMNVVVDVIWAVKESIEARKLSLEEAKRQALLERQNETTLQEWWKHMWKRLIRRLRRIEQKPEEDNFDDKYWQLEKAKALLSGKRESAADDILWGCFQVSLVFFDVGRWKAIGHAWMLFLIHVMEEALLNDSLTWTQKRNKLVWLTGTAYLSGRIVFR